MERIIETGLGSFQIRSRWRWVPEERIIEVYEIPYTTKTDIIIDRIIKLSKEGKVREIADIRDETDLSGLRIAIDLKRGVDPEKLMAKLYRTTTLQDSFSCNFNVLVDGYPRVMGVRQILHEWVAWRIQSTRRRVSFDLSKKSERLHLLHGLEAILLDIDKAIAIIRGTKLEAEVVPNLMRGFDIDETQAEFVAELKLRNINEEYILNRTKDIAKLEAEIAELEEILSSEDNIKKNPNADTDAVEKETEKAQETAKEEKSDAKTPETSDSKKSDSGSSNGSKKDNGKTTGSSDNSGNKSNSSSKKDEGKSDSKPSGGNSSNSGSNTNSGSSSKKDDTPAHVHKYDIYHPAVTHTEKVYHPAVTHTEKVYHPAVTHTEERSICNGCGADITGNEQAHAYNALMAGNKACGAYHTVYNTVTDSAAWEETVTITDSAAWEETVTITDSAAYYTCSCGARK